MDGKTIVEFVSPLLDRISTNASSGYGTVQHAQDDFTHMERHKSIVHHFKITQTNTTEADYSAENGDDAEKEISVKKRKKWWACLNWCRCNDK